jgi:hypothetical protein
MTNSANNEMRSALIPEGTATYTDLCPSLISCARKSVREHLTECTQEKHLEVATHIVTRCRGNRTEVGEPAMTAIHPGPADVTTCLLMQTSLRRRNADQPPFPSPGRGADQSRVATPRCCRAAPSVPASVAAWSEPPVRGCSRRRYRPSSLPPSYVVAVVFVATSSPSTAVLRLPYVGERAGQSAKIIARVGQCSTVCFATVNSLFAQFSAFISPVIWIVRQTSFGPAANECGWLKHTLGINADA